MKKFFIKGSSLSLFLFLLCGMTTTYAQSSLYFQYDPTCVTKLDYEREGKFHDIPFTDYVFQSEPNQRVIFRVKKIAINKAILTELPKKAWVCGSTRKITPNMIKGINQFKAIAYIVVPQNGKYELLEVNSVATVEEANNQIKYDSEDLSFSYTIGNTKTDLNLNTQTTDKNIFYQKEEKINCTPQYNFSAVYKSSSAAPYQFHWLKGLGFEGIYTPSGKMKLKTINDQSLNDYFVRACGVDQSIPAVENANISPYADTVTSLQDMVANSKTKTPKIDNSTAVNPYASTTYSTTYEGSVPSRTNNNENSNQTAPGMEVPVGMDLTTNNNMLEATKRTYTQVNGFYTVQEDDNLYEISEHFGLPITRLMEINGLQSYAIDRTQMLKVVDDGTIPHLEKNPIIEKNLATKQQLTIHVVEQGENLYRIAKKYNLTLMQLFQLNNLKSNDIDIDQRLIVAIQQLP